MGNRRLLTILLAGVVSRLLLRRHRVAKSLESNPSGEYAGQQAYLGKAAHIPRPSVIGSQA